MQLSDLLQEAYMQALDWYFDERQNSQNTTSSKKYSNESTAQMIFNNKK